MNITSCSSDNVRYIHLRQSNGEALITPEVIIKYVDKVITDSKKIEPMNSYIIFS